MDLAEQALYAQSDHVEQLNSILLAFHKELRRYPLLYNKELWDFKAPVAADPDTFCLRPSIKLESKNIRSLYEEHPVFVQRIANQLGWGLELKPSTNKHHNIKTGVFVRVKGNEPLRAGTLVGFVPGIYRPTQHSFFQGDDLLMARGNGLFFSMNRSIIYPNETCVALAEYLNLVENWE